MGNQLVDNCLLFRQRLIHPEVAISLLCRSILLQAREDAQTSTVGQRIKF